MTFSLWPILALVAVYFLVLLGAILKSRFNKTGKIMPSAEEFFLAKRSLPLPVLIGTYVGTLFSAFTAVGIPGAVYTHGIGVLYYLLAAITLMAISLLVFGNIFRKRAAELGAFSPLEVVSRTYDSKLLGILLAFVTLVFLTPYLSIQLVGMGKLLEGFSGGQVGYLNGVGFIMGTIILYLIFGGMRAVAYTDFIQAILIFIGLGGAAWLLTGHFFESPIALWQQLQVTSPAHTTLPGPAGLYTLPAFASFALFVGLLPISQPHTLTRVMMAPSKSHVIKVALAIFIAGSIAYTLSSFIGLSGVALFPELGDGNLLPGTIMQTLAELSWLGLLVTGLLLVGVIAASMSTADSLLISIGQVFTRDILRPYIELTHNTQVLLAKVVMVVVLAAAFWLGLNPPPVMIDLALYSLMGSAILVPTIVAMAWRYRCKIAAAISILVGEALFIGLLLSDMHILGFHPAWWGVCLAAMIILLGGAGQFFLQRSR